MHACYSSMQRKVNIDLNSCNIVRVISLRKVDRASIKHSVGDKRLPSILSLVVQLRSVLTLRMTSQPIDEDGFHSIAWDDAPPSSRFQPSSASSANTALPSGGMGGFGETESEGGFETISPPSDAGFNINANSNAGDSGFAGSSKGTMTSPGRSEVAQGQGHQRHISSGTVSGERLHAEVDPSEWGGKWMAIDVKDPVKEHEGSKDMFVSYAVRTRVCFLGFAS